MLPESSIQGMSLKKVFFVDDDEVTLFLYRRLAKKVGVEAVFCENGKEFLEKYGSEDSDALVILDINMPVLNGIEVIKSLKEQNRLSSVAVVAMLGLAGKDSLRNQIVDLGVDVFADKPLNEEKLTALLEQGIR